VSANTKQRAEMLAKDGCVAFAADIYGKGIRPTNGQEAAAPPSSSSGEPGPMWRAS